VAGRTSPPPGTSKINGLQRSFVAGFGCDFRLVAVLVAVGFCGRRSRDAFNYRQPVFRRRAAVKRRHNDGLVAREFLISLIATPAIASQEQNVRRFACHTYPSIPASSRAGWNHERVSKGAPCQGKKGMLGVSRLRFTDSSATATRSGEQSVRSRSWSS
jgi:hypothetical protein